MGGQDEIEEFLQMGKGLQVNGFEGDMSDIKQSEKEEPAGKTNFDEEIHETRDIFTKNNIVSEKIEAFTETSFSSARIFKEKDSEKIKMNANSDLDLQIALLIEKSDGVWICKVCGKTAKNRGHITDHAETHIEGISHAYHICDKAFSSRPGLRYHKQSIQHKT